MKQLLEILTKGMFHLAGGVLLIAAILIIIGVALGAISLVLSEAFRIPLKF